MGEREDILAATSEGFQALHAAIGDRVRARFDAEPVASYGIAAWRIPVPKPPGEDEWKGTMPRTHLVIAPAEKKAGVTMHVWHPNAPYLLRDNEAWLKEAGFKVMVGCLQWNRKADMPLDAVERLLDAAKQAM